MISKIYIPTPLWERYKEMKKQPKFPRGGPQRNMTHSQLVDIAHRWVLRKSGCHAAFKEMRTEATTEIPDVMGFGAWGYSVMVECKVSRADFLRDKLKQHKVRMGKYRFYCAPKGLLNIRDLPDGYGLIEVSDKGKICYIHNPFNRYIGESPCIPHKARHEGHETCFRTERNFLYSAVRRKLNYSSHPPM